MTPPNRFFNDRLPAFRVPRYEWVLKRAIILMVIASVVWLGYQFWRLLFQTDRLGAIDLRQRFDESQLWFAGASVYLKL